MIKKSNILIITVLILLTVVVFRNYFLKGQVPFPGNLLVAFYSPWKLYEWKGYPNGPPNKPIGFDSLKLFYPYRKFTVDQLKTGQWPLWNPYNFSGNIHLATYQSAVFYPLNIVYFLLPLIDAWSLLVFLQPVLAGFFTYLFLKKINLSARASFFGALVFAFSGWMTAWMEEGLVIEHSALWLPLILYGIEKVREKISLLSICLLIVAITSTILAGFLQMTIYIFMTAFAWILFQFFRGKQRSLKVLAAVGACFFLSFLISAVHLWPAIESYFLSPRGIVDVKFLFEEYLLRPEHLITLIAPDFWGNPGSYNYFGRGFYHEKVIYLGIPALLFSLYAFFIKFKDNYLNFFKYWGIISLALGFFPFGWILYYLHLPLISVMIPSRILFIFTFCFSVLAAYGLDYYLKEKNSPRPWIYLMSLVGLIIISLWVFVLFHKFILLKPNLNIATISLRNLILPTSISIASFVLIYMSYVKTRLKSYSFFGLAMVSFLSSLYFANKFLYFSEREFVFPQVPVLEKLKELSGINRVWGYGEADLYRNTNAYYQLYSSDGYDALFSRKYGEFLNTQETNGKIIDQIARTDAEIKQASEKEGVLDNWYRERLMSLLGVKYVMESKDGPEKDWISQEQKFPSQSFQPVWQDHYFRIWEYKNALPRMFLVYDYIVESNSQKIADYLFTKDFDISRKIVLEKDPGITVNSQEQSEKDQINLLEYSANKLQMETTSPTPALLFISDNYYPGWRAYTDEKETEIFRADYSFRAIAVPAGRHRVTFSYQPASFFWGLRVSIFSLAAFTLWLIILRKIRKSL